VIHNFKLFLQDLISIHTCHIKTVIHHLLELFKLNKILIFGNIKIHYRCIRVLYNVLLLYEYFFYLEEHNDAEHETKEFKIEDMEKLNHIHDTLRIILKTVPM